MGVNKRDLSGIGEHLVPNAGDEAWVVDPNQRENSHSGQDSGTHADGY